LPMLVFPTPIMPTSAIGLSFEPPVFGRFEFIGRGLYTQAANGAKGRFIIWLKVV
jgi:hypothetical protein